MTLLIAMMFVGEAHAAEELALGAQSGELPSAWASGWVRLDSPTPVEAYGQLGWPRQNRLYLLNAHVQTETLYAVIGRQRLVLPTAPRLLDGALVRWGTPQAGLTLAAGRGTHSSTLDGSPLVRAELDWSPTGAELTLGAWSDLSALHGDASATFPGTHASLRTLVSAASAPDGVRGVERARAELRAHPAPGVDVGLHVEHREAIVPGLLNTDVLSVFAPEGRQEAGALVGVAGRGQTRVLATGALRTWSSQETQVLGAAASLSLQPTKGCSPSWRMATGPLGTVHSFQTSCPVPLPQPGGVDHLGLVMLGGVAPYQKGYHPWDTALWGGGAFTVERGSLEIQGGAELAHSAIASVGSRAWASLRWTL